MHYFNSLTFHEVNLNLMTQSLNTISNFFLTPTRYILGSRSGTCFQVNFGKANQCGIEKTDIKTEFYGNINEKKSNLIKIAFSIALFIPSLIIGAAIKIPALLYSAKLRQCYKSFDKINSLEVKAINELQIGLFYEKEDSIKNYFNYVNTMNDQKKFFLTLEKYFFIGKDGKKTDVRQLKNIV